MVIPSLFDLTDRVVVITGAGGLLGQEHSLAVGRAGGFPVLLDVSAASLRVAGDRLASEGLGHLVLQVDVTVEGEVAEAAFDVMKQLGAVWGLVNNVASNPPMGKTANGRNLFETFPIEQWNQDIQTGLTSALLCSRHFGQQMAATGGGSIVNVASDLAIISPDQRVYAKGVPEGQQPPVKPVSYSVVKAALLGLTRYLSTYWSPIAVRCNALLPGSVRSTQGPHLTQALIDRIPLARLAEPNEYHGALVFLLSDASSYMTGSNLVIDGGRTSW